MFEREYWVFLLKFCYKTGLKHQMFASVRKDTKLSIIRYASKKPKSWSRKWKKLKSSEIEKQIAKKPKLKKKKEKKMKLKKSNAICPKSIFTEKPRIFARLRTTMRTNCDPIIQALFVCRSWHYVKRASKNFDDRTVLTPRWTSFKIFFFYIKNWRYRYYICLVDAIILGGSVG